MISSDQFQIIEVAKQFKWEYLIDFLKNLIAIGPFMKYRFIT